MADSGLLRQQTLSKRSRALIASVGLLVTAVFFINFCDLVYRCGCRSLWAGAAAHCNIHRASGPHCPWCSVGQAGSLAVFLFIAAVQGHVAFRTQRSGYIVFGLTLLAFPAVGAVLAIAMGVWKGYWT
jgi:hypothetical protein